MTILRNQGPRGLRTAGILAAAAFSLMIPYPAHIAPCAAKPAAKKPAVKKALAAKKAPVNMAKPANYELTVPGTAVKLQMVGIPGGTFMMPNPAKKGAMQKVTVKPFWIESTELPWEAYDAFSLQLDLPEDKRVFQKGEEAVSRPSKPYLAPDNGWGHDGYPAMRIHDNGAVKFCKWLSQATGKKYRLPTEAEWEYACRAGKLAPGPIKDKAELDKIAWYKGNSEERTHPVAKKAPNAWGLYDMLGNVAEWCRAADGTLVVRGGSYMDDAAGVCPSARQPFSPDWQMNDPQFPKSKWWLVDGTHVGLRLVCEK